MITNFTNGKRLVEGLQSTSLHTSKISFDGSIYLPTFFYLFSKKPDKLYSIKASFGTIFSESRS